MNAFVIQTELNFPYRLHHAASNGECCVPLPFCTTRRSAHETFCTTSAAFPYCLHHAASNGECCVSLQFCTTNVLHMRRSAPRVLRSLTVCTTLPVMESAAFSYSSAPREVLHTRRSAPRVLRSLTVCTTLPVMESAALMSEVVCPTFA